MGYGSPPPSYLPESLPVDELDEEIISDMKAIGYIQNWERDTDNIKRGVRCPVTVTYNLLLKRKSNDLRASETKNIPRSSLPTKAYKSAPDLNTMVDVALLRNESLVDTKKSTTQNPSASFTSSAPPPLTLDQEETTRCDANSDSTHIPKKSEPEEISPKYPNSIDSEPSEPYDTPERKRTYKGLSIAVKPRCVLPFWNNYLSSISSNTI